MFCCIIILKVFVLGVLYLSEVYLDNCATTVVCDQSVEKIVNMLSVNYGNPSSLHSKGLQAELEIRNAKDVISNYIGCRNDEIFFTSGGTESNNLAVIGAARANAKTKKKIITTSIEHSSVIEACKYLETQGFCVEYINPDETGYICEEKIYNAVDENVSLVSIMMVNNEVGTIQDVSNIKKILRRKRLSPILHVDAVQAFGKIPVKVKKLDADLGTMSAHKIHGPKGVGAIYIKKGVRIVPLLYGGEQQSKIRPGTESAPLIAGFSAAINALPNMEDEYNYIKSLRDHLVCELLKMEGITINSPASSLAYIVNFSVDSIKSETLLHKLAQNNIYVSSGSACAKGKKSYVLKAMGFEKGRIDSAIRVSFSRYNTLNDIDKLICCLKEAMLELSKK